MKLDSLLGVFALAFAIFAFGLVIGLKVGEKRSKPQYIIITKTDSTLHIEFDGVHDYMKNGYFFNSDE